MEPKRPQQIVRIQNLANQPVVSAVQQRKQDDDVLDRQEVMDIVGNMEGNFI